MRGKKWIAKLFFRFRESTGASMVEFAVTLPLLVVLVVGIFDFGGAFNTKQELNNAVREGAHLGASEPSNDLCIASCSAPTSVDAIRYLVHAYLQSAQVNDCGLSAASLPTSSSGSPQSWEYDATGCPWGTLKLTINRGVAMSETEGSIPVSVLCTQVSIVYPYPWHFNNVIQLISPGSTVSANTNIQTSATAMNMD
jgi:hypothetical protein